MIKNYVLQRCNAPGTNSNVLLGPAQLDRLTWGQAYADGAQAFYFLDDGVQAEWGVCTFHAGTPATISRDTVVGNTAVNTNRLNFTGAVDCYNEIPGERMPFIHGNVMWAPTAYLDPHSGGVPIGASMDYWGTVAPTGWVFANGQSLSRTSYALLFAVLSTTYGAPDANTFRVPNRCESFSVGRAFMGGAAGLNRMNIIANINVLGAVVGNQDMAAHSHALNWSDPGHAHVVVDGGHLHGYANPGLFSVPGSGVLAAGTDITLGSSGVAPTDARTANIAVAANTTGIAASNATTGTGNQFNIPPAVVCNVILYAGPIP